MAGFGNYLKKHTEALVKDVGSEAACGVTGKSKATLGRYYSDAEEHADRFMPIDAVAELEAAAQFPMSRRRSPTCAGSPSPTTRRRGTWGRADAARPVMCYDRAGTGAVGGRRMDIAEAADLIDRAYAGTLGARLRLSLDMDGAQAFLLKDGTLVVPGTNELSDWGRFNFDVTGGDSGRVWHAGFMRHARIVYPFAKGGGAKRVVGHSLGAASAQIVAASLGIPAFCFAAPRPLRGRTKFRGEGRILCLCRLDDAVCHMPFAFLNFRHLGKVHWVSPREPQSQGSHRTADYLRALAQGTVRPVLPAVLFA